jgi:hypothetical protein
MTQHLNNEQDREKKISETKYFSKHQSDIVVYASNFIEYFE